MIADVTSADALSNSEAFTEVQKNCPSAASSSASR
jgi:hypothetical protein